MNKKTILKRQISILLFVEKLTIMSFYSINSDESFEKLNFMSSDFDLIFIYIFLSNKIYCINYKNEQMVVDVISYLI